MLNNGDATAQFFDRKTDPAITKETMKGLQQFMIKAERLDRIISRLEKDVNVPLNRHMNIKHGLNHLFEPYCLTLFQDNRVNIKI